MPFVGKSFIDWSVIRADYVANAMSTRALARAHQVTEGAIRKRAKRGCWERIGPKSTHCVPNDAALTGQSIISNIVRSFAMPALICSANDNAD
jgi:hypothetical protein